MLESLVLDPSSPGLAQLDFPARREPACQVSGTKAKARPTGPALVVRLHTRRFLDSVGTLLSPGQTAEPSRRQTLPKMLLGTFPKSNALRNVCSTGGQHLVPGLVHWLVTLGPGLPPH